MRKADLVELRPEGLYCAAGDFWIDPWRPVPRALITHAHGDHARWGMGEYVAAEQSLGLLRARVGADSLIRTLAYRDEVTVGRTHVSFHPAGHVLGSAQIRIEHEGEVWVVSGDYKRAADPTCAPFEVVECDTFITEATFALPIYRWQSGQTIAREVLAWWDRCIDEGRAAVLFCYALGKAQRLLSELSFLTSRGVFLHGAMVELVNAYRAEGIPMLATETVAEQARGKDYAGQLILAPPSAAGSTWMRRFKNASTGFASGWMQVRGNRRRRGYDRGFVLSDHADWPALVQTVRETRASRVLATHGNTEAFVEYLCRSGVRAETLRTEFGGEEGASDAGRSAPTDRPGEVPATTSEELDPGVRGDDARGKSARPSVDASADEVDNGPTEPVGEPP
jgi:putative mRNA 3-end processing factor